MSRRIRSGARCPTPLVTTMKIYGGASLLPICCGRLWIFQFVRCARLLNETASAALCSNCARASSRAPDEFIRRNGGVFGTEVCCFPAFVGFADQSHIYR